MDLDKRNRTKRNSIPDNAFIMQKILRWFSFHEFGIFFLRGLSEIDPFSTADLELTKILTSKFGKICESSKH